MKLRELVERVKKTPENRREVDFSEFLPDMFWHEMDYEKLRRRLSCYVLATWICTDTEVGQCVYFVDDAPVAYSSRPYRKSREHVYFLSAAAKEKFLRLLAECRVVELENEKEPEDFLEWDFEDGYEITYAKAIIPEAHKSCFVKATGRKAELLGTTSPDKCYDEFVKIKFLDNEEIQDVNVNTLLFPYNITE